MTAAQCSGDYAAVISDPVQLQLSDRRTRLSKLGWSSRVAIARASAGSGAARRAARCGCLLALQLDLGFQPGCFTVVGLERGLEAVVGGRIEISTALFRPIDGVSERLRGLVCQLSSAESLESGLSVVERVLRYFAGAVELMFQSVE